MASWLDALFAMLIFSLCCIFRYMKYPSSGWPHSKNSNSKFGLISFVLCELSYNRRAALFGRQWSQLSLWIPMFLAVWQPLMSNYSPLQIITAWKSWLTGSTACQRDMCVCLELNVLILQCLRTTPLHCLAIRTPITVLVYDCAVCWFTSRQRPFLSDPWLCRSAFHPHRAL